MRIGKQIRLRDKQRGYLSAALKVILLGRGMLTPTYYIDSVAGSDTNSGRSIGSPLATIAALPTLKSGDVVGLKCGGSWRERLSITTDRTHVVAYGTGVAPIMDCADVIPAVSWTKTAGKTNVYQADVTVEGTHNANAANWASVWCDGVRLVQVADTTACDAAAGSYVPSSTASNTPTYYIHAPGDTNPASDGKVYEYAKRSTGVDTFTAQHCIIKGVRTKRNYQSYGSLTVGRFCEARDCFADDGNTHNVYLRGGAQASAVAATNGYAYASSLTLFIHFEATAAAEDVLYEGCTATMTVANAGGSSGFYGHTGAGAFGTITHRGGASVGCDVGFQCGNAALMRLEYCRADDYLYGCKPDVNTTIRGFTLTNPRVSCSPFTVGTANLTFDIDSLVAVVNKNGTIGIQSTLANTTITVTNCSITGVGAAIRLSAAGWNLTNNNNSFPIWVNTYAALNLTGTGGTYVGDNNNYGGVAGTPYYNGASSYTTLALWQAATGQDANSTP